MKIVFIVEEHGLTPSGVATVVCDLINKYSSIYKDISLISNSSYGHLEKILSSNPELRSFKPQTLNSSSPLLKHLLKIFNRIYEFFWLVTIFLKINPSVIISHNGGWPGGRLNRKSILISWLLRVKHRILVLHNYPINNMNFFVKLKVGILSKIYSYLSTSWVTVSKYSLNSLIASGFRSSNSNLIYNFISNDLSIKKFTIKKNYNICFVGALEKRKGVHLLLELVSNLPIDYKLHIFGTGDIEYENRLREISYGLKHTVKFYGYVDNVRDYFVEMDFLILPSTENESFGLVLIEAMSHGVITICSDVGGMTEVISDNNNGIVFKNGNILTLKDFFSQIQQGLVDPNHLLLNAYNDVLNRFDLTTAFSKYTSLH